MRNHQSQGIILKSRSINDTDKFVTIITRRFGRIDAIAKGATKITSRFTSSLDALNLCGFELYKSKNWLIREAVILNGFRGIKTNLRLCQTVNIIINLIYKTTHGEENEGESFMLLKKILVELQKKPQETKKIFEIFKIELLRIHGLLPHGDIKNTTVKKLIAEHFLY